MEEKVVSVTAENAPDRINPMLKSGWKIRLMVAENVSTSVSASSTGGSKSDETRGLIVFVLEKFA